MTTVCRYRRRSSATLCDPYGEPERNRKVVLSSEFCVTVVLNQLAMVGSARGHVFETLEKLTFVLTVQFLGAFTNKYGAYYLHLATQV